MERRNLAKISELVHSLDEKEAPTFVIPPVHENIKFVTDSTLLPVEFNPDSLSPLIINYFLARKAAGDFCKKTPPYESILTYFNGAEDHSSVAIGTASRWVTFTEDGVFISTISAYPLAIMVVHAHLFTEESIEVVKEDFMRQKHRMFENCNAGWIEDIRAFEPPLITRYKSLDEYVINLANYAMMPLPKPLYYAPITAPHLKKPSKRVCANFLAAMIKGENPYNFPKIPERVSIH